MRLMEHALGRASQDSLHQQREDEGRTFLLIDELHNLWQASIRGSRLISGRLMSLEIDHFSLLMVQLFSLRERSDVCGEQKTLSRLKKRAKSSSQIFLREISK